MAAASWTPQQDGLSELLGLFRESQNPDRDVQIHIANRLETLRQIPDYANYLVYVLTQMPQEETNTRSIAGLILKNHILNYSQTLQPDSVAYVKAAILPAISLEEDMLRRTSTQVVSMIMEIYRPESWPEGLEQLISLMTSQHPKGCEGAFSTLAKMCEDIPKEIEECEINGMRPLQILIPKFLEATNHPDPLVRCHALNCLNQFISASSAALQEQLDLYIKALFERSSDPNDSVRRFVCQAIVLILGARPDKLLPQLSGVVDYMLYCTADKDDEVALEACEFWLQFSEDPQLSDHLRPYLPTVAPVLLKSMVYSEIDLLILGADQDDNDEAEPDRPEDIKPKHYGGATKRNEHVDEAEQNGAGGSKMSRAALEAEDEDDDEDDDDEDDYEDDSDDDGSGEWNLRKCSAAALDVMAVQFGNELLQILLPYLKERLFSDDWLQREAGILALGAIAEGCIAGIHEHLPQLVPFLINSLQHPKPLVRSIACWTLGRYSSWTVGTRTPEHQQQYFLPAMEGLLGMVLDRNKRVQEAGCSAFATLEEEAGASLQPFLEPILKTLVFAFNKYQQKNLLILYDAIGTLADCVESALNRPEYVEIIMPPLISKWQSLDDGDADLIPLLECLSSVTIAVGPGFLPYSPPVFQRCVGLVHSNLVAAQAEAQKPLDEQEMPNRTFIIVALDLLSGLTQGLGADVQPLIEQSNPSLLPLLGACLTNPDPPVRQSAYALLGDLAICAFRLLRPQLPSIMKELIAQIVVDPPSESVSVCNNATWAAGEIALQYQGQDTSELHQWIPSLTERLIPVLMSTKSPKSLMENAAVTIGRIGLVCPALVAPHLEQFIEQWCQALWDIKDNDEKDSAFRGLCAMIQANPNGAAKGFVYFCNAVVRWTSPSQALNDQFSSILNGFKEMAGPNWQTQRTQFPSLIAQRLEQRYGL
ncbi:ARM repeat-containing protein [Ceraceosorus guamensis]|uniref:ARM repeat-containing protein n=1 Tax=Ceraceosorus guamensis TaxID=1522189 RepID=A0A316VP34_9BASI|nr:ARM repeat-containing protein [Ceraceosorus guamensis]PWN39074.1 ARM repeat-containing protein [Ceraceosorus guamensis]